jgi:hypothetical protein
MLLYAAVVFLSAFLLFEVQPILGKYLLPRYGGTAAVWTTCLIFFQTLLLGGYAYAHWGRRLGLRRQSLVHLGLVAVSLVALPIASTGRGAPESWPPAAGLLLLLLLGAGAPYLVLSATGPLLQSWRERTRPGSVPYRLFALSNVASLLALVAYPFAIEPRLGLAQQCRIWSWGYALFALLCGLLALAVARSRIATEADGPRALASAPPHADLWLWAVLPFASSLLLVATTNQVCQDVSVVPFLWIVPLALYLLSFILVFSIERLYHRAVWMLGFAAACAWAMVVMERGFTVPLAYQIGAHVAALFAASMVCHGELVRFRPAPAHLTSYYLAIAAGGAAGAAAAGLLAPALFAGYWEYPIGQVAVWLLAFCSWARDPRAWLHGGRPILAWLPLWLALATLATALAMREYHVLDTAVAVSRSFYGTLRVEVRERDNPLRSRYTLMNGRIEHGFQFQNEERRRWPTAYFGADSGVGLAIRLHPTRAAAGPMRIGVVGLGAGTLAAYGGPGDYIRFYELNPDVVRLSTKYFTYVSGSPARVEIALGDARMTMEQDRRRGVSQQFDVLAVDAFSGDAIPVHLLTRESFDAYWYHLKPDGVLAFHISSHNFDLGPVTRALALERADEGMEAVLVESPTRDDQGTDSADWVLVTRNRQVLDSKTMRAAISPWARYAPAPLLWTDDHSNLFRVLSR